MRSAALRKPAPFEQLYCSAEIVVLIRGLHFNLDLEVLYLQRFGEYPPEGCTVRFVLAPGAEIRSRSTTLPACRTGRWSWL